MAQSAMQLPVEAADCGLRITGLWGGVRWAGGRAGPDPAVTVDGTTYGWLGFISQGGLAVTLAAVLRRAFPEWNVSLEALLVAMIGVHQLAGPICFQWVLRRSGEITEEADVEQASSEVLAGDSGGGGRMWFSYDNGSQREAAETCRETRRLRAVASLRRHPDRPTVTHHLKMLSVYQLSTRTGWHVRD